MLRLPLRRSFVSQALLSKSWQSQSVAELRQAAKSRGLLSSGSKSTLVSRLREHENHLLSQSVTSEQHARYASTNISGVNGSDTGIAPGIPAASPIPPKPLSINYLDISLPDISTPEPVLPVQIPLVPDLWKSGYAIENMSEIPPIPKMVVVGGVGTNGLEGPSHNLIEPSEVAEELEGSTIEPQIKPGQGSIFDDISEDLGLPYPRELGKYLFKRLK